MDDVMPRRDGPDNLKILKRQQFGFLPLRRAVEFFGYRLAEMNGDLKHHKMRCALWWGQHNMVSIDF